MKTKKSITKRFKITKTGKVLRRPSGQDHCKTKKTGKQIRKTRKWVRVAENEAKKIKKLLPGIKTARLTHSNRSIIK